MNVKIGNGFLAKAARYTSVAALTLSLGLASCNKNSSPVKDSSSDLSKQIELLAQKYKVDNSKKGPSVLDDKNSKKSPTKAAKLALADGVGGVIGASGGVWGALWGGFLMTLSLEPHFREPEPKKTKSAIINPSPTVTQSNLFDYAVLGDGHNTLMHAAYIDDFNTSMANNHLNANISNLLINTQFQGMPQPNNGMAALYGSQEALLIDVIAAGVPIYESQDIWAIVDNSNLSEDTKEVLNDVMDAVILNDMIEGNDFTNFFNDVEELVKSGNLSQTSKTEICYFLAIANSSMHYWKQNFPM